MRKKTDKARLPTSRFRTTFFRETSPGSGMTTSRIGTLLLLLALSGCALHQPAGLHSPPRSVVVTTGGPNRSAIHLSRVDSGILVFDLGWWGAETAIEEGLAQLGATADDVIAVFLTHSHRDHLGGWRTVRHAPFYVAVEEVDLLFGWEAHGGWIPRWAERLKESDLPGRGELTVRAFGSDTSFVFGRDTLRAFRVTGHTAGSTAYLFRGRLLVGDAIAHTWIDGFRPAIGGYSESVAEARRSLESLRVRLAPYRVLSMCTAHLECSPVTDVFWSDLLGSDPP